MTILEVKAVVRSKNQLTLPDPIVRRLGVEPGDEIIVRFDDDEPGVVHLRSLRRSYAGVAKGIYGSGDEEADYVQNERAAWNE
jgi:bifunctional DNA-binding transcriptional regulator/antitoxin component of YhaV-PrlF toxin-antitoxin module